ncbi:MAG: glycoside hydrolase [Acidobacteria bacterium]|nr:glycoside hydrolase [Acidobacteriota bacterium]
MTRVALLWHMHQPFYQDLVTGEHVLPWVRLHALKDYWGMVALLREFPSVRVTFNLVPSMLVQLQAFADEQARDRHLDLGLKPAANLTEDERIFCVERFFHAQQYRMIDAFPRYAELRTLRGSHAGTSPGVQASRYTVDDLRDLQVWHKLVWIDQYYFDGDERIRGLLAKGREFSEEDKLTLRDVELELLRKVVPEYRDAAARGQVELSTSPFYHPILPLLCDTDVYLRTHPHSRMPRERFQHPEDAAEQLRRAVALHERLFGSRPIGVWPSEGSVSDAMVPLVAEAGFRWMATDEGILAHTLGRTFTRHGDGPVDQPDLLYRPYLVGSQAHQIACGFRDHSLSDRIGFHYASWSPEHAADDFTGRLVEAGRRYAHAGGGDATVFVILDGENAWEHFEGQGRPFLRALYHRLGTHPALTTVTMADACADAQARLPSIFPGSWINSDFYIWAGHADDHRAWTQLAEARRALEAAPAELPQAALKRALEEMLIAEGSDWFWWYGDDHSSDHDLEFDDLFRRHVRNVYRFLDMPIPEDLFVTNISTQPPTAQVHTPTGLMAPVIDGQVSSYFEWLGAGYVDAAQTVGAMHRVTEVQPAVTRVEFGFDLAHLYVRVDGSRPMRELLDGTDGLTLSLNFLTPAGLRVVVGMEAGQATPRLLVRSQAGSGGQVSCAGLRVAVADIVEVLVPFTCLDAAPGDRVAFLVALSRGTAEVEHHPRHQLIEVHVPGGRSASVHWSA